MLSSFHKKLGIFMRKAYTDLKNGSSSSLTLVKLDKSSKSYKYKTSTTQLVCVLKVLRKTNNNNMILVEQHINNLYATNADQYRILCPMHITHF
jgi:hypothetical protein